MEKANPEMEDVSIGALEAIELNFMEEGRGENACYQKKSWTFLPKPMEEGVVR